MINFNLDERTPNIIKVIGIGGGGGNAVEYMYTQGIHDVDFVICNTDDQVLKNTPIPNRIRLGNEQTIGLELGLGAGNDPEVGRQAAEDSKEEIKAMLNKDTKMAFITATLGGGTGTGAAPVVARMAKEMGILTVGIVAVPERTEGEKRVMQAMNGLQLLKEHVDSLIVIDNENISRIYDDLPISDGFNKANEVLNIAAKGIAEIITLPGYVNVDFADVKTVMTDSGVAIMGSAKASGEDRARQVIADALESPLLNNSDILGAQNILLNITSGKEEIRTDEMKEITSYILRKVGNSAAVIWGVGTDEKLEDAISVTVIATGFPETEVDLLAQKNTGQRGTDRIVLTEEEVVVKPDLTDAQIRKLEATPAYERRNLRMN
jgi:cell division protein FtsZ